MKKLGLLGLVLLIALGAVGVGYAKWSDTVYVQGIVQTGTLKVGIRDAGTNDPGEWHDPKDVWVGGVQQRYDKHVASCESQDFYPKCMHNDIQYYEKVRFTITNAYPSYAPAEEVWIANCGDIPIKLDPDPTDYTYDDPLGLRNHMNIVHYKIVFPNGTVIERFEGDTPSASATQFALDLGNVQIDPCQVLKVTTTYHFLESAPMGATLTYEMGIRFSQWNKVP